MNQGRLIWLNQFSSHFFDESASVIAGQDKEAKIDDGGTDELRPIGMGDGQPKAIRASRINRERSRINKQNLVSIVTIDLT